MCVPECAYLPFKPLPSPVRLYCRAAEAQPVAPSSTESQTPAAFTVSDLCLPFDVQSAARPRTTETQLTTNHLLYKKEEKNNNQKLTPINMFLLSNGRGEVVWYPWTKNKLFGSGHSRVSDWLTAWAKFPGSVFVSDCFSNSPRLERVLPQAEKW